MAIAIAVVLLLGVRASWSTRVHRVVAAAPSRDTSTAVTTPRPAAHARTTSDLGAGAALVPGTETPTATPTVQAPAPSTSADEGLNVQPRAGPPGARVVVSGAAFAAGVFVSIAYTDIQDLTQVLAHVATGADGQLPATAIVIPANAAPGGLGMIVVSADGGGQAPASAPIAVTPLASGLNAVPDVAAAGATVELDGSGFGANSAVRLSLIDARGVALPVNVAGQASGASGQMFSPSGSSVTGSIGPLQATIPAAAAPGLAVLNAADAGGTVAGIPITIVAGANDSTDAHLQLRPARAAIGTSVILECAGFAPDEQVALQLPQPGSTPAAPANAGAAARSVMVADAFGRLDGQFVLPEIQGVTVEASSGGSADAGGSPVVPGTSGNAGMLVQVTVQGLTSGTRCAAPLEVAGTALHTYPAATLSHHPYVLVGSGFGANERVDLTQIDDAGVTTTIDHYQTDASGGFTAFEAAPSLQPPGDRRTGSVAATAVYFLQATGAASGLSVRSRLVVTDAPAVILPQVVAAPGQDIQVEGSAFAPHSTVVVQATFPGTSGNQVATATGVTDDNGIFAVRLSVPTGAAMGAVTVQAQDAAGNQAGSVLTVNARGATAQVRPRAAQAGQVITVQGSGFGSGEAIDLFLAQPGSGTAKAVAPLANSTLTVTADALGAFSAAYPLPQPLAPGTYLVYAAGEISQRRPFFPVTITGPTGATPLPTATPCRQGRPPATNCPFHPSPTQAPRSSPTPTPITGNSVLYFADASTGAFPRPQWPAGSRCQQPRGTPSHATPASCALPAIRVRATLALFNAGTQPSLLTIAYFLYGARTGSGAAPLQLRRSRTLVLAPLTTAQHSINDDIGDGQVASVIVRGDGDIRATLIRGRAQIQGAQAGAAGAGRTHAPAARALDGGSEPPGVPSATWYFPEGAIDGIGIASHTQFAEYLHLLNPDTSAATVRLRFMGTGTTIKPMAVVTVGGGARLDLDLRAVLDQLCPAGPPACVFCPLSSAAGSAGTCLSTLGQAQAGAHPWSCYCAVQIESSVPLVAERTLYWGSGPGTGKPGFASGPGVARPAVALSLAYISRVSHDQAFLSIADPGAQAARITVLAFTASGIQVARMVTHVGAGTRTTLALDGMLDAGIYSLDLRASRPVVAEVAQYRGSPGNGSSGMLLPAVTGRERLIEVGWDGASGQAMLWVFNPGAARINVTLTLAAPNGPGARLRYQLAPQATLRVALSAGLTTAAAPRGTLVTCDGDCVGAGMAGLGADYGEVIR